jgi:hypothetical protein
LEKNPLDVSLFSVTEPPKSMRTEIAPVAKSAISSTLPENVTTTCEDPLNRSGSSVGEPLTVKAGKPTVNVPVLVSRLSDSAPFTLAITPRDPVLVSTASRTVPLVALNDLRYGGKFPIPPGYIPNAGEPVEKFDVTVKLPIETPSAYAVTVVPTFSSFSAMSDADVVGSE